MTLVAPAPAASQDLEVLAAAAGELRDVIAGVSGPNRDVAVARAIHRGREGAVWSGAALDTLRSKLETVLPQAGSTMFRSATLPLHPSGDVVLVTLRLNRAAVPGGWAIERWEEAAKLRISRAAGVHTSGQ